MEKSTLFGGRLVSIKLSVGDEGESFVATSRAIRTCRSHAFQVSRVSDRWNGRKRWDTIGQTW